MLRIVAWDDPRCVQPLEAACRTWSDRHSEECRIIRRPLTAFNDQPLSELAPISDVMIIDYPHVAQAIAENAITPICDLLQPNAIETIRSGSIGPAQDSFVVDGQDVALASDAACQVAAFRPDVLDDLGADVPSDWKGVFALAERHAGSVAVPLYHTDAISCLFSLTAGSGAAPDGGAAFFPDRTAAEDAVDLLIRLAASVDPVCWQCTPQKLYAHAGAGGTIAYLPLTFGYTWLTAPDKGGWRFGAPPAGCGSLLGGAGMAVSSQAQDPAKAAEFAEWYCAADCQRDAAFNGGQPAGLSAWTDPPADDANGGFFSATFATQEQAYVRPRAAWWPAVQTAAGEALVTSMRSAKNAEAIIGELENIYTQTRAAHERIVA